MKRAFRVATVFTGAAACATALGPAAQAVAVAPAGGATRTPDTVNEWDCSDKPNGALHLYWVASEHHSPVCFSGSGFWYVGTGKRFRTYCGDYSGSLEINGTFRRFTPGVHKLTAASVEEVYLSRYNAHGGVSCS